MSGLKLITEEAENVSTLVVENGANEKSYFIEGVFMQANTPNKNKRIYPLDMMAEEVQKYINEYVTNRRALGELGHPTNPSINLHLVSHTITELYQDGNNFVGKAKILNTPNGKITMGLMEGGWNPCVSSRGLGALKQNSKGLNEVSNYKIATAADLVWDPSCSAAVTRGIMEGADWVFEAASGSWVKQEHLSALTEDAKVPKKKLTEEHQLKIFERYMQILAAK
jgi:hypothetical protein